MVADRDLAAVLMVIVAAFIALGFANGYFAELPTEVGYREFVFLVPMVALLPLIRFALRWTALATCIVGVFGLIVAVYNLATFPSDMLAPPALGLLLIFGFTFFAFKAYLSEGHHQG
jgi:hypothetical protein